MNTIILKSDYVLFFVLSMATCFVVQDASVLAQTPKPKTPAIASASESSETAIETFKFPENLNATLFAAEPDVANPVAFHIDYQNRLFVCESFRQENGVEDNRNHSEWLNDDLASQSVADRIAYMRKHLGDEFDRYSEQDDRIRLLVDEDGDGVADRSSVFAEQFNSPEMGTGAGVLSYAGNVYFTCIPDLFLLNDADQDGAADSRKSLHHGYGVRFAFRGHDLHGLIIGPDRRLYFSIGDRGYNISSQVHDAASGAVFRCDLDGGNLQVVATGLRNPQELAFDNFGNLFTGDNNSDSGDKARWVYVVTGGDTGWRMHYQYLPDRGPFNREKIWHLYSPESSPAYIIPPVAHVGDGPSGLSFYPGTGLSERFENCFFLADFRGVSAISGIRTFRNKQQGAFFEVTDMDQTFWQMLATDVDFGIDGRLYVSDWVFGWQGEGKGRIYSFQNPELADSKEVLNTAQLLSGKIGELAAKSCTQLLRHRDRRVRQEAQFRLVDLKRDDLLLAVASRDESLFARLHALWGLEMSAREQGRTSGEVVKLLKELCTDGHPEIRAQAAKLVGDLSANPLHEELVNLTADANKRVQYFAAMSLEKIGRSQDFECIAKMLIQNADADPIVRHGGIVALSGILKRQPDTADRLINHESRFVRIATVVALRKNTSPKIARFLRDADPQIRLEAARAIYDLDFNHSMPELAYLIHSIDSGAQDALIRRVIHANQKLRQADHAEALGAFILNGKFSAERRRDAVKLLSNWSEPNPIDGVTGAWRPQAKADSEAAMTTIAAIFEKGIEDEAVCLPLIDAATKNRLDSLSDPVKNLLLDPTKSSSVRAAALTSLQKLNHPQFETTIRELQENYKSLSGDLLGQLCAVLGEFDAEAAAEMVLEIVETKADDIDACQAAIASLATSDSTPSKNVLNKLLDALQSKAIKAEFRLDVVNAAAERNEREIEEKLSRYNRLLATSDLPGGKYHDSLFGGNEARGREIFFGKTEVSCVRCHVIDEIGGEVGPELSEIGKTKERSYLLEAITLPNKSIADGYAQTIILTDDGEQIVGIVKSRDDQQIQVMDADGNVKIVLADSVDGEKQGQSSMPADLVEKLTPSELRDLVEYLVQRKQQSTKPVDVERPASHQ